MSPRVGIVCPWKTCFPRVSGDEPQMVPGNPDDPEFSPRERG